VIGKLRDEMPIIDRDKVDDVLLRSMAQQLDIGIFPLCKMIQVDPAAVKRMLDEQFRRAYGLEVEADVLKKLGLCRLEDVVNTPAEQKKEGAVANVEKNWAIEKATQTEDSIPEEPKDTGAVAPPSKRMKLTPTENGAATDEVMGVANALMELKESVAAIAAVASPDKKKKATPPNNTQKELKTHVEKRKRGKYGVRIATLRSMAVSEKWEALNDEL
jgi:hypothetical protein